jgi:hypothetical protein
MANASAIARIVAAATIASSVLGCAGGSSPRDGEDRLGYYEVQHEQGIYVLGSMASAEKAKAGTLPAKAIRRLSSQGVPVYFEADGAGLENQLMGQYNRRHGLSE